MSAEAAKTTPEAAGHGHDHGHDHGHGHGHDHGHGHHGPAHLQHHFDTPEQQFNASKLGMWVFLVTEVLFFGGLFCAYAVYRSYHTEIFDYAHTYLDKFWGAVNTVVLITSSLTMAWAVRNAQLGQKKALVVNLAITLACAYTFMVVKTIEYHHKYVMGILPGSSFSPSEEPPGHDDAKFAAKHPKKGEKPGAHAAPVPAPAHAHSEGKADDHGHGAAPHAAAAPHGHDGHDAHHGHADVRIGFAGMRFNLLPFCLALLGIVAAAHAGIIVFGPRLAKAATELPLPVSLGTVAGTLVLAFALAKLTSVPPPEVFGRVASIEGDTMTVAVLAKDNKDAPDTVTVKLNDKTEFLRMMEHRTRADFVPGTIVSVDLVDGGGEGPKAAERVTELIGRVIPVSATDGFTRNATKPEVKTEMKVRYSGHTIAAAKEISIPLSPETQVLRHGQERGQDYLNTNFMAAVRLTPDGKAAETVDVTLERPSDVGIFFSIYFCMTGLHGIHVAVGIALIGYLLTQALHGAYDGEYFTPVDLIGLYWHIVDLIWIYLFPLLYLIK
jgi:cytochrome c oxidase subunit 3